MKVLYPLWFVLAALASGIVIGVLGVCTFLPTVAVDKPTQTEPTTAEFAAVSADADRAEFYEVPLDKATQRYVSSLCSMYGIDSRLIYGVMYAESRFDNERVNSKSGCFGIMQLNPASYNRDTYSPLRRNIYAGVALLANLLDKYSTEKALTCYCYGVAGAKGMNTSAFANRVISYADKL